MSTLSKHKPDMAVDDHGDQRPVRFGVRLVEPHAATERERELTLRSPGTRVADTRSVLLDLSRSDRACPAEQNIADRSDPYALGYGASLRVSRWAWCSS